MRKVSFREALELFGDMLNQEADRLQTSPDSLLAKIMEYGPEGAAIREDYCSRVFMASYRVEPAALVIGYTLESLPIKSKNAIIAAHVMRDLRTDKQRALKCECSQEAFRQRLSRGRKELRRRYLQMSQTGV
jgi:DNA-directed RNA polymerase specialized sigma24 family protein